MLKGNELKIPQSSREGNYVFDAVDTIVAVDTLPKVDETLYLPNIQNCLGSAAAASY